ncbi:MAG: hypothetical protein CVT92_06480 [Bacteroidetes bacterium HGW-Bacteroidetes-1]|jgi:iron complex transport system substrate-binding protein|nr:MAG: hypothetical protein CVT92_06480 [Bacteroidetes bacterium HGW-Bacteroidetes-1]
MVIQNMKNIFRFTLSFLFIFSALLMWQCRSAVDHQEVAEIPLNIVLQPEFAKGFIVSEKDGLATLSIFSPWNENQLLNSYILWPDTLPLPDSLRNSDVIFTPVKKVAALSATQWSPLLKLGMGNIIKGVSESRYIQNKEMLDFILEGKTTDVASDGVYKVEQLVAIEPDLIMYSPDPVGVAPGLKQTNISLLAWPDYFETVPLGRTEWIKVLGLLVHKEKEANQLFDSIASAYNNLKKLAAGTKKKPTIFADKIFAGQWYIPGGNSYMAVIFKDAGAEYIFSENGSTASFPLDIETIFNRAKHADFWRIAQATDQKYTYELLLAENELYKSFDAFQNKKIIYCNTGKSAYFEQGSLEPQKVLADFIAIFHPELLPEHTAVYHQILK